MEDCITFSPTPSPSPSRFCFDPALERVYEVTDGSWEERLVTDSPIASVTEAWDFFLGNIPEKLLQDTLDLTEHEANLLTGYYLPGDEALEQVVHLLDRVRSDDPLSAVSKMHRDIMANALWN